MPVAPRAPRRADTPESTRTKALQRLVVDLGRRDFEERYPERTLSPVVALICAYEEEANIGAVIAAVPRQACGLPVTTLVVVDGGEDDTAGVARKHDALTFVLPANLGHGMALRVGYRLCIEGGARYVVTLDADGQNDPSELESLLSPLVEDTADFVVASRRLGVDETTDRVRQAGVRFFAWLLNALTRADLTDTSNGYRALRTSLLVDVVDRLTQDQYQTAELLLTALGRGWRVAERPTVWHERVSGHSKKGTNLTFALRYAGVVLGTWWRERRGTTVVADSP
ncbi:MAG TPA: glycosyltransferase family 2 protein [Acidimicrobiales bacterium]|nr:glycosyltransferase family 2 protein [Acidimicrobiales bacterium]